MSLYGSSQSVSQLFRKRDLSSDLCSLMKQKCIIFLMISVLIGLVYFFIYQSLNMKNRCLWKACQ